MGEETLLFAVEFSSNRCAQQEKAQIGKQREIVGRDKAGETDSQWHKQRCGQQQVFQVKTQQNEDATQNTLPKGGDFSK